MTHPPSSDMPGYGSPPTGGAPQHPSAYGQVQDAAHSSPYLVDPGSGRYGAPDAYSAYRPPQRPTTPALGRVALAAGLVALIGSIVNALIIGALFRPESFNGSDGGNMAALMSLGLANLLLLWFGFGLWAIIQGAIAISQKRGVPEGIGALVLGIIGPWVGAVMAFTMFMSAVATS